MFLLSKRPEPVSPVPGAVLESETVTQEHEADSSGRESEKDQTGAGKAYGDQSGGGMAAGLPGSLVKAQQAEGRISEDSLSQAGTPGMERETGEEYCLVSEKWISPGICQGQKLRLSGYPYASGKKSAGRAGASFRRNLVSQHPQSSAQLPGIFYELENTAGMGFQSLGCRFWYAAARRTAPGAPGAVFSRMHGRLGLKVERCRRSCRCRMRQGR